MKIGDRVRIKRYNILGQVQGIEGRNIVVIDDDGFEYILDSNEVAQVDCMQSATIVKFMESLYLASYCKQENNHKKSVSQSKKLIIDLHFKAGTCYVKNQSEIHRLQIENIRDTLKRESTRHGRVIIFIHGKGDGILRNDVVREVLKYDGAMTYQDAPVEKYGYQGALKVSVR